MLLFILQLFIPVLFGAKFGKYDVLTLYNMMHCFRLCCLMWGNVMTLPGHSVSKQQEVIRVLYRRYEQSSHSLCNLDIHIYCRYVYRTMSDEPSINLVRGL